MLGYCLSRPVLFCVAMDCACAVLCWAGRDCTEPKCAQLNSWAGLLDRRDAAGRSGRRTGGSGNGTKDFPHCSAPHRTALELECPELTCWTETNQSWAGLTEPLGGADTTGGRSGEEWSRLLLFCAVGGVEPTSAVLRRAVAVLSAPLSSAPLSSVLLRTHCALLEWIGLLWNVPNWPTGLCRAERERGESGEERSRLLLYLHRTCSGFYWTELG